MARTSAILERLKLAGVPYISVLTDPIYGGVSASLAILGDINIAEPYARAGFAGPNIIEQTIRQKLPRGFQRSEFLLEHGAIDMIVPQHGRPIQGKAAVDRFIGEQVVLQPGAELHFFSERLHWPQFTVFNLCNDEVERVTAEIYRCQ